MWNTYIKYLLFYSAIFNIMPYCSTPEYNIYIKNEISGY